MITIKKAASVAVMSVALAMSGLADGNALALIDLDWEHAAFEKSGFASIESFRATKKEGFLMKAEGAVLAKRDAWARIAGCMREEAGSVVGSVIV